MLAQLLAPLLLAAVQMGRKLALVPALPLAAAQTDQTLALALPLEPHILVLALAQLLELPLLELPLLALPLLELPLLAVQSPAAVHHN